MLIFPSKLTVPKNARMFINLCIYLSREENLCSLFIMNLCITHMTAFRSDNAVFISMLNMLRRWVNFDLLAFYTLFSYNINEQ